MDKVVNKVSHASDATPAWKLRLRSKHVHIRTHAHTQALNVHNEAVTEFSRQLKWLSSTPAYRAPEDLDSKLNKVNIHKIRYTSVHICTFRNQRWFSHSDTHECSPDKQSPSCPFFGLLVGIRSPLPPSPSFHFRERDACLAVGTFPSPLRSLPRRICRGSSLSLQNAQRKKIRKLPLMKTRSTLSIPSSSPLSPSSAVNLERRERRRIKLNSNHSSSAALKALKCKCACVSFSLWFPLPSPAFLFLWTDGESLQALQVNHFWSGLTLKRVWKGLSWLRFAGGGCFVTFNIPKPGLLLPLIVFLLM